MLQHRRQASFALSAEAASRYGEAPAFTQLLPCGAQATLSFDEVEALAASFAAYLTRHLGLCPGDMLAVQLPNALHLPVAVFGAWKAGLVVTLLDPLLAAEAVAAQLAASGARALVLADLYLDPAQRVAAAQELKLIVASLWDFLPEPQAQIVRQRMEGASPRRLMPDVSHHRFDGALVSGRRLARLRHRGGNVLQPVALQEVTASGTGRAYSLAALLAEVGRSGLVPGRPAADSLLMALPFWRRDAFALNLLGFFRAGVHSLLLPDPYPGRDLRSAVERFPIRWLIATDALYVALRAEPWYRASPPQLEYALADDGALRIADCPDAQRRCWLPQAA